MILFLIVGLIVGALAVIFALQNITATTVSFLAWQLHGSLSLVLILAILSGVLVSIMISIPSVIRGHLRYNALWKQNKKLTDELNALKAAQAKPVAPAPSTVPPQTTP